MSRRRPIGFGLMSVLVVFVCFLMLAIVMLVHSSHAPYDARPKAGAAIGR